MLHVDVKAFCRLIENVSFDTTDGLLSIGKYEDIEIGFFHPRDRIISFILASDHMTATINLRSVHSTAKGSQLILHGKFGNYHSGNIVVIDSASSKVYDEIGEEQIMMFMLKV